MSAPGQKRHRHFGCFRSNPAVGSTAYGRPLRTYDAVPNGRNVNPVEVELSVNLCAFILLNSVTEALSIVCLWSSCMASEYHALRGGKCGGTAPH